MTYMASAVQVNNFVWNMSNRGEVVKDCSRTVLRKESGTKRRLYPFFNPGRKLDEWPDNCSLVKLNGS